MTASHPQEKANELIHTINAMMAEGINRARLREILDEAEKLEKFGSYVAAKRVKGMVAAVCGDAKEVDRHFNAAVTASGRDVTVLTDYATALGNIHHHVRSVDMIDEAVNRAPDDLFALQRAIDLNTDAYNVDGVRNIQEQLDKLGQQNTDPMFKAKLDAIDSILSASGASWNQVSERIELVADTLNKLGLFPGVCSEILSDGIILYEFNLDADIDAVINAENAVHHAIADKAFSPADRAIAFSCAPV